MGFLAKGAGMNVRDGRVEEHLKRASAWWKWQTFIRRTSLLATLSCLGLLLLGGGMMLGWFDSLVWAGVWIGLVVLISLFAWMVVGILIAESSQDTTWLASVLEKSYGPLMDRLNALVYLRKRGSRQDRPYAAAIEQQTIDILARAPARCPFSWRRTLGHIGISMAMLAGTATFYLWLHPWNYILAAASRSSSAQGDGYDLEGGLLEIPDLNKVSNDQTSEEPVAWGEVRITQPGHDVRATRLEVVPLEIEVAANRRVRRVRWISGLNAQPEAVHELTPPDEKSYAVYDPFILPEDHQAGRADVIAYYAEASSESVVYASDLYFVDIVPLREEIDQLPGGRDGVASRVVDHVSSVIEWQQDVVRNVHRLSYGAELIPGAKRGAWNRLAEDVANVTEMIRHLRARFEVTFEPAGVADIIRSLEQAHGALRECSEPLRERRHDGTMRPCWSALGLLISARKHVYDFIQQHPHEFIVPEPERHSPESVPDATHAAQREAAGKKMLKELQQAQDQAARSNQDHRSTQRLQQMRARQEELDDARKFVQDALAQQRNIERKANPRRQKDLPQLAEQQRELTQSVENFFDNQALFRQLPSLCSRTTSAMRATEQALQNRQEESRERAGRAADSLQELDDALEEMQQRDNLPSAYALKRMLENELRQLKQFAQRPDDASAGQCQQTGSRCKSLIEKLKEVAARCASDGSLGPALHKAMRGENAQRMAGKCDKLAGADSPAAIGEAAQELREELQAVKQAFDDSLPRALAGRSQPGAPGAGHSQAVMRALRQFRSGALRQRLGRQLGPEEEMRLRFEAFDNLNEGIRASKGSHEPIRLLVEQLERDLRRPDYRIDMATLVALLEQIQRTRTEGANQEDTAQEQPLVNIDPADFPAPYRDAIQRYFQKLSEQP